MEFVNKLNDYADNEFNGYLLRDWLKKHMDVSVYTAALYLTFVFVGPRYIEKIFKGKLPVGLIKKVWMLWNLGLSIFSLCGTLTVLPMVNHYIQTKTFHEAVCGEKKDELYRGRVGFALALFAVSKLPEFGDTVFLLFTGKKTLPFLQWFHHVTTFLFAWMSYQCGSSIFIFAAAMNYFVHTIMYFYFALAEAGFKNLVKPFGIYITLLQILQMVGGLCFSGYAVYQNIYHTCPGTSFQVSRTQLLVYICNFYLFSEMFVKAYILPKPARPAAAADKKK